MESFKAEDPEGNEREVLKCKIREALEKFEEFTDEVIADFLQTIEKLEIGLKEKFGPQEELLCRERVDRMVSFLEKNTKQFARVLKQQGLQQVIRALLTTLSVVKEYSAARKSYEDEIVESIRNKFTKLRGSTPENVDRLARSILAIFHTQRLKISAQLIAPFLAISDSALEDAIAQRGEDKVFPEIVNSVSYYIHKQIVESN